MDSVKTIHRFWAGSVIPQEYQDYGRQWKDLNPDWIVKTWSEASAIALVRDPDLQAVIEDFYRRDEGRLGIELYVQLADVIGYFLVAKFGGVYVNCDSQPLRPLAGLLPNKAWASYENNEDGRIVNAAIGAPQPNNEFWTGLLKELPARYFSNPTAEMVETTGPALLTDHAHAHWDQIHVFPVESFNPIHWKQIASGENASGFTYPDESIAVHHWGHKKDGRSNVIETGTQR